MSSSSISRHASFPAHRPVDAPPEGVIHRARRIATSQSWPRVLVMTLIPAVLLLVSGMLAGLPPADGELVRGVSVAGITTTDRDWASVEQELRQQAAVWLAQPITVQIGNSSASFTPEQLGVTYDDDATFARALTVGRGDLFDAAVERFGAHTRGIDVSPVVVIDQARLMATLKSVSDSMLTPARGATYVWNGSALQVNASTTGTGLDAQRVARALEQAAASFAPLSVTLDPVVVHPKAETDDLVAAHGEAQALFDAAVVIGSGDEWWQITPTALARLLTWDEGLSIDRTALTLLVATIAPELERDPTEPRVVLGDDARFTVAPLELGRALNVSASVDTISESLLDGEHTVALTLDDEATRYTDAELQELADQGNAMVKRGMTVHWSDGETTLDPWPLASALTFDPLTHSVGFDNDVLFHVVEPIAHGINRPATGFRWKDFQIVAPDGALPGRTVDISASVNRIASAVLAGQGRTDLVVNEQEDPASGGQAIVISDMLGSSSTYYGGSSYNRMVNVELAASQLDGALIQPGGTFSFNTAIGGTATLDDGYQMGYGLVTGSGGEVQTVPSVAGGICQVATTVFQAAFWSGMPIGNRNWHLYWIPNYGDGPGGLMGLDATVDPDYGLDFTFNNPTDDWLAINAVADGEWITIEVWGTNQGWQVSVDGPELTNVVKADPTPIRRFDASIPAGSTVAVEHAQDGFTANIHREVVASDGTVVDDRVFTSYYQPARNVTLVGDGVSLTPDVVDSPPPVAEPPVVIDEPVEAPIEEPVVEPTPTYDEEPVATPTPLWDDVPADVPMVEELPTEPVSTEN